MVSGSELDAVLIAGPTASGKSAFALRLARATGGVVVNVDSMQLYRDLRIITARPTPAEEAQAPHRVYGVVDGAENFSVGRYAGLVSACLAELAAEGRLPILTGGTGLYFRALEEGLSDLPAVSAAVREAVRDEAEGVPTPELHARLAHDDPETASRLRPGDRLRVLRALEIWRETGMPLLRLQGARQPGPLHGRRLARVFLAPDRAALHARIDSRFEEMMDAGALDEVRGLAARRLDPALPIMRAHGVPGLIAHLGGEATLAEAVRRGQADTRAYVKRQFTWFRNQMTGWIWLRTETERERMLEDLAHAATLPRRGVAASGPDHEGFRTRP